MIMVQECNRLNTYSTSNDVRIYRRTKLSSRRVILTFSFFRRTKKQLTTVYRSLLTLKKSFGRRKAWIVVQLVFCVDREAGRGFSSASFDENVGDHASVGLTGGRVQDDGTAVFE